MAFCNNVDEKQGWYNMGQLALDLKQIHFDVFLYNATSQFDMYFALSFPSVEDKFGTVNVIRKKVGSECSSVYNA